MCVRACACVCARMCVMCVWNGKCVCVKCACAYVPVCVSAKHYNTATHCTAIY